MYEVFIREYDFSRIGIYRVALSEDTNEGRIKAISGLQHLLDSFELEERSEKMVSGDKSEILNDRFVMEMLKTTKARNDGIYDFSQTEKLYDQKFERKLNIAEVTGHKVLKTIVSGEFRGVQSRRGILEVIGDIARNEAVRGAIDKDVRRKIWMAYRGVVHFGMAEDFCERMGFDARKVITTAEEYRHLLSHNCPSGSQNPYVPENEQIKFTLKSNR